MIVKLRIETINGEILLTDGIIPFVLEDQRRDPLLSAKSIFNDMVHLDENWVNFELVNVSYDGAINDYITVYRCIVPRDSLVKGEWYEKPME